MNYKKILRRPLDVHACELPKTSQSNLPKLPPSAKFHARWKRNFQKHILVSVSHPLTRNMLRSNAAIAFEKRRHGRSGFWWVIHPCSDLRFCWDILMTFTFLYMLITVPYILAFHRVAKSSDSDSWSLVYPVFIICIFDIALNFITGVCSPDGHEIFLDPVLIAWHYIKSHFLFDLLSSIPYVWFHKYTILPPGPNSNSVFLIPEFLPLLKVARLRTLRFYVKQIATSFAISHATEKTIWLIILILILFHWCCCVTHLGPIIIAHIDGQTMEEAELYYITTGLYQKSNSNIYLMCFHMGLSNFFASSFIELYTLSKNDTAVRCTILLLGKGCLLYVIVMVLQLAKSGAEPELKYQRIMYRVNEYIREKKLPDRLKNKLLAYYEYRFQGSFFKEKAISSTISNHLYQEIMIHSSRGLLDTATLLHYLPRNVIGNLMGILKPVIYLKEDIIYQSESEGDYMFFIISGTVTLITFHGKEICHEKDGGHFGEGALIFPDRRRLETVMALEVCELLRLNRRDFKRMFSSTSTFYKRLEKIAKERQERMLLLSNSRQTYLSNVAQTANTMENNQKNEHAETPMNDITKTENENKTN